MEYVRCEEARPGQSSPLRFSVVVSRIKLDTLRCKLYIYSVHSICEPLTKTVNVRLRFGLFLCSLSDGMYLLRYLVSLYPSAHPQRHTCVILLCFRKRAAWRSLHGIVGVLQGSAQLLDWISYFDSLLCILYGTPCVGAHFIPRGCARDGAYLITYSAQNPKATTFRYETRPYWGIQRPAL